MQADTEGIRCFKCENKSGETGYSSRTKSARGRD